MGRLCLAMVAPSRIMTRSISLLVPHLNSESLRWVGFARFSLSEKAKTLVSSCYVGQNDEILIYR
ncbi:Uncharacterised protein [Vibrio cholerae]|nr:Uncharacterised protein [Vibrio cholerae]CSD37875.1 Uncharacterised protein [Vibrio cholerae]